MSVVFYFHSLLHLWTPELFQPSYHHDWQSGALQNSVHLLVICQWHPSHIPQSRISDGVENYLENPTRPSSFCPHLSDLCRTRLTALPPNCFPRNEMKNNRNSRVLPFSSKQTCSWFQLRLKPMSRLCPASPNPKFYLHQLALCPLPYPPRQCATFRQNWALQHSMCSLVCSTSDGGKPTNQTGESEMEGNSDRQRISGLLQYLQHSSF